MELRAKLIAEGYTHGLHRSPYNGFSVEFSEYQQYSRGDDPRHIDWRVAARSDRYFIKKFEDETNLRCRLIVDQSRSMAFGSKAEIAATMAATLAWFLSGQGDAVGLTTFDEKIDAYLPTRNRPGHLRRLMLMLEKEPGGAATEFGGPLEQVAEMERKRGMFVLISDLLAPLDALDEKLGYLVARGQEVVVFQLLDEKELSFDYEEPAEFRDLETGTEYTIDPQVVREEYLEKLNAHCEQAEGLCKKMGAAFHRISTEMPMDQVLSDFLLSRREFTKAGRVRRST